MEPRGRLGRAAFILALLAGARGAVAAELTCVFKLTRETVRHAGPGLPGVGPARGEGAESRPTKEARRTVIGLADDSITATHEGETTIAYDFPSRRMYVLDLKEKTYADLSLYGLLAYRFNKLVRRRPPGAGPAAAGAAPDAGARDLADEFAAESLFSRRLPADAGRPDAPAARLVRQGKEWEFERDGRRFVRFLPSGHPMPPRYRRSWARFLVHQCSIHPTIREQILRQGAIPDILEFSYFDELESCKVTYRLESAGEGPGSWAGVPPGFTPKDVPGDRLGPILARLDPGERPDTLSTRPAAERFVEDELARGNALDAYLGWNEYTGLAGEDAESRASKAALLARILAAADGRVSSLRFRKGKPDEFEAILKAIDGIDRRGLKKGYQLDAYRGFLLIGLGRIADADDSFLGALEANPYLLNCYRQLGDDRVQAFETVEAWRCFDAIRRVDPDSFLLRDVKALEARLENDFPEDF